MMQEKHIVFILAVLFLLSCAGMKPVNRSARYTFLWEGEKVRLHSVISQEADESFIRLISDNFLAFDYDMDGMIDQVAIGNGALDSVQKIYQAGIEQAGRENKLSVRLNKEDTYKVETSAYIFELKSYETQFGKPFNEFKMTDKRQIVNPSIVIALDNQADGELDLIIKGSGTLRNLQAEYKNLLNKGMKSGTVKFINDMYLARKK